MEGALGVAFTLFGLLTISCDLSGACLNPAVGVVQSVYQYIMVKNYPEAFGHRDISLNMLWLYILAPLTGAVLAGCFSHMHALARPKTRAQILEMAIGDSVSTKGPKTLK